MSYTFSKSLDDDYAFGGGQNSTVSPQTAQDWLHPERQRGLSTFDQRHVLSAQMTYTTGMGLGGKALLSGWKGALYKEWSIQTSITAASGTPETPTYTATVPGTNYSSVLRADYVTGQSIHASTPGVFINPKAFQAPAPGQYGNARRDSIPGPNQFSLNASMVRNFRMHDRYNLNAEIAANNVLNHVMYTNWYTSISPAAGGSSTLFNPNTLFGTPSNANPMRSITATVRLRF